MRINGLRFVCLFCFACALAVGCAKRSTRGDSVGGATESMLGQTGSSGGGTGSNPASELLGSEVRDVFFEYDRAALREDARATLQTNAATLKSGEGELILEGHCDSRGTVEYNLALGERRAQSVREYLVNLGLPGSRLQAISYGEERPFEEGDHEGAWSQNRRVHFRSR